MKKYTKQEWAYTTIGLALGVAVACPSAKATT